QLRKQNQSLQATLRAGENEQKLLRQALDTSQQHLPELEKTIAVLTAKLQSAGVSQKALADSQSEADQLRKQNQSLQATLRTGEEEKIALNLALKESQKKAVNIESQLLLMRKQNKEKPLLSDALQKNTPTVAKQNVPMTSDELRDYALGAFWAQEMTTLMKSKEAYGYQIARQQVLSGITDMVNGHLKVPKEKLINVLQALDKGSSEREEQIRATARNEGRQLIQHFHKLSGVQQASEGYYYLVIDKGAGSIKTTDIVAVTIRESLANGKVISDMNAKGTVLELRLSKFPSLFKSAISHVNNHGRLQIVVPPVLAYGNNGRMPDIPPESTMVYDIQIIGVVPKK
ncbi:FKBP-type peptidyl-prolyl cis-trans isomerase, partial [Enterobacter bugandensis]|uniref:FKBP-type peptidyl-prolyl cis-trans isomerase n=1 Tax=Enterobacter bugandensis TaxID=881260 RepID=UPI0006654F69